MTEQQIEAAARRLCELRGEDPDEEGLHYPLYIPKRIALDPDAIVAFYDEYKYPKWVSYTAEVRKALPAVQVQEAIEYARSQSEEA